MRHRRAATQRRSAIGAASSVLADGLKTTGPRRGPVFVGLAGGVGRLPEELARALRERGVDVRTKTVVQQVRHRAQRWDVVVGDGRGRYRTHTADAVIFATPATVTAQLLADVNAAAAAHPNPRPATAIAHWRTRAVPRCMRRTLGRRRSTCKLHVQIQGSPPPGNRDAFVKTASRFTAEPAPRFTNVTFCR